ncbi:MAG: hypothetical protein K2Q11_02605 [Burkholderiaceae bacterium]|nr:hypothetical protein [Burkholderiaceae bacterium]
MTAQQQQPNALMADAYESMADLMMGTLTIQMSGITREELIATFKAKYPVEAEFEEFVKMTRAVAEMQVAAAEAGLQPGQHLAMAWPVEATLNGCALSARKPEHHRPPLLSGFFVSGTVFCRRYQIPDFLGI